jgi:assimilatory nitrate reductase catalytic subunit
MPDPVRTTCPYCGVGCGIVASPTPDGWRIDGDPDHPANRGRLCSKGLALADTLGPATRLPHPEVDGRPVGWDAALDAAAGRLGAILERHGPDAVAFYLSGQLLTEDYYAANKLAKGFLGTANVDTNSRLCMASTVAGHRRAFGADIVPGTYEDLELADLVVLVGSNLAWCHPVLFQRLKAARRDRGTRVVVIDPRRTGTCDIADLHLAVAPGGDTALFAGLLAHLADACHLDRTFIAAHVSGFDEALAAARAVHPPRSPAIATFYDWFAATPKVVTVFSQGVNQSAAGTDTVNAILNLHLATGRIGRPGMGPFSVTGQPNAMGGREVGGLANQLAAHMDFEPTALDRVRRFWDAPRLATRPGRKAVDMFDAIERGEIKAVWIMATNPAVSLPEADRVRRALAACPLVIVSDCVADTDTVRLAHIRLPALAWGEKDGTVTNSDRTISRQRSFLPAMGEARADWRIVADIAGRLGYGDHFAWDGPGAVFAEYARLTAFENGGTRALDLSDWIGRDYQTLAPAAWGGSRFFARGRFYHPDGKARCVPVLPKGPAESPSPAFPLVLNTGRYRDQWHTMTRTGLAPRLVGHRPEPLLDIHPDDAGIFEVEDGALVQVESRCGDYLARARFSRDQRRGELFLPLHWSDAYAARAAIGRLVPAHTDPISGQPESKRVPVTVRPVPTRWAGILLCREDATPPAPLPAAWWVRHRAGDGLDMIEMAGDESGPAAALPIVAALDAVFGPTGLEVSDPARGVLRRAWIAGDQVVAALFLEPDRPALARGFAAELMGPDPLDTTGRIAVLAGRTARPGRDDEGPLVCACYSVGVDRVRRAIREHSLTSVAEIGDLLKAGTGCGSCIPELKALMGSRVDAA